MNAVEIEEAVSALADEPFDADGFPFAFLEAFGNKATTIKRLKSGSTNHSDVGGVLQRSNIHLKVSPEGEVTATLAELKSNPVTERQKAKFILATDGKTLEAENLVDGETLACDFVDFHHHFGFFLPLAGISTVKQIRENAFDIKATSRLNKLYIELLRENPEWATEERRNDLNHFMARLIFCFFAEDTDIFRSENLFTATVDQMSERDSSNTHEIIAELFRAMDTKPEQRAREKIRSWADVFPYVNGELFRVVNPELGPAVPRFSRIARSYLLHVGNLDWTRINPDIFGSMIQAVADEEERGALGMHYTSVPNILKVLNPLFLDELREKLEIAGDNKRKLLNLRNRIARIRVFDPACGSGNFLVIAYKEMRAIEAEINERRGEVDKRSVIPLTNFRGIEIRHFSAEIARLALIIAEYQCDVRYIGQKEALVEFLPLDAENWITCGNALRLDWLSVCPPTGKAVKTKADDLFETPLDQTEIDFENEGGETFICGNPPYLGFTWQSKNQKKDISDLFSQRVKGWKSLDYVAGWFLKAAEYSQSSISSAAFVTTNSINQGQAVPILWPIIFGMGQRIIFAHTSFKWANLANHNAGVTVAIIGISNRQGYKPQLFSKDESQKPFAKTVQHLNAYLVPGEEKIVIPTSRSISNLGRMEWGNKPTDGGNLVLRPDERRKILASSGEAEKLIKRYLGSKELIQGIERYCLWIDDEDRTEAETVPEIKERIAAVAKMRQESRAAETRPAAAYPHRFRQIQSTANESTIAIAGVSSERREFLPVDYFDSNTILSNLLFALYDAPLWNMALIASRIHLVWIGTVCGKLKTDYRYSNTLGWNTFPVPTLTEQNKADLTRCAEDILLAREAHFPATIADLYDPDRMPDDLRAAHDRNDETLERIYIGRRFKNDTERLETLFSMYSEMTSKEAQNEKTKSKGSKK